MIFMCPHRDQLNPARAELIQARAPAGLGAASAVGFIPWELPASSLFVNGMEARAGPLGKESKELVLLPRAWMHPTGPMASPQPHAVPGHALDGESRNPMGGTGDGESGQYHPGIRLVRAPSPEWVWRWGFWAGSTGMVPGDLYGVGDGFSNLVSLASPARPSQCSSVQ